MFAERPYQREARIAVYEAWRSGEVRNPLVEIGTAGGKSVIIANMMQECVQAFPDTRIVMVTHVKELVKQNYLRLKGDEKEGIAGIWEDAPAGIYSAGLKRKELHAPILFAGIQSIYKKAYDIQGCDIMIIDEAHLVPHHGEGQYRQFIDECLACKPYMKIVGFTASPFRLSSGMLTEPFRGTAPLFDSIVYSKPYVSLLQDGYVAPLVTRGAVNKIDTSNVGLRGGEFIQKDLAAVTDRDDINAKVVAEIVEAAAERGTWLVFCVSVAHAYHIRDLIRQYGITCEAVTDETPSGERDRIIEDFRAGKIRCLTNKDILTTGTDIPSIDYIALLRATQSPGLLLQVVGRGVRLNEGKTNCLVMDFGSNFTRLGPIDQLSVRKSDAGPSEKREAPAKECPKCQEIVPAGRIQCACGYEWPRNTFANLSETASDAPILSTYSKPEWYDVTAVEYHRHYSNNPGKPDSLRVIYRLGLTKTASEWISVEGIGGARRRAEEWWARRDRTGTPCPADVRTALLMADDLRKPGRVMLVRNGKYHEVVAHDFSVPPQSIVVMGREITTT